MTERGDEGRVRGQPLHCIANGRRREILRLLLAADAPAEVADLATRLSATGRPSNAGTRAESGAAETGLYHVHLPKLATAGLVRWDGDAGTVEPGPHPALDDPRFRRLLAATVDGLDGAIAHVARERRRVLLTVLRNADASLTRTDLARELLRADDTDLEPGSDAVADVVASLHHRDLPSLDADGLVAYDRGTGRVTDAGHPGLDAVFAIVFEPESTLTDRYDGFLRGMGDAAETLHREAAEATEWPDFWSDPHHG